MILKSLKLKNVRSYKEEIIDFPNGSVLLSGDIGSGKSTILLAIEFALFGLLRGDLSGSALLRHGCNAGSVELCFQIDNKDIVIKRVLKKNSDKIEQDSGSIIKENLVKQATAVELKTEILDLLGYPKDLLTKSKSMIYRYTVYTPQEDMKRIILESSEVRLDVLRKVFDIDKYKRIKDNCDIIIRFLREKRKELEGFTLDLEEKKTQKQKIIRELNEIQGLLSKSLIDLQNAKVLVIEKKNQAEKKQSMIKEFESLKRDLDVNKRDLLSKAGLAQRIENEISIIKEQLEEFIDTKETLVADFLQIKDLIKEKSTKIINNELNISQLKSLSAQLMTQKSNSEDIKSKILSLNNCPLCKEQVSKEHKHDIVTKELTKIKDLENELNNLQEKISKFEKELIFQKEELENLKNQHKDLEIHQIKLVNYREKTARLDELKKSQEQILLESKQTSKIIQELEDKISKSTNIEKEFEKIKNELELSQREEKQAEIQVSKLNEREFLLKRILQETDAEINKKDAAKNKIQTITNYQNWLKDYFINLVELIERHVMGKIYYEFNDLFKKWFNMIIEDEVITAQLDDHFTPVIQQNGYDVEIENLSGGEKTACALAYRLALNKVINDIISNVKTKDLLILDEPTDGFSSEQLDKIREVLNQLDMKQIIIVSHEHKIESFVDHVIRIRKDEHISKLVAM